MPRILGQATPDAHPTQWNRALLLGHRDVPAANALRPTLASRSREVPHAPRSSASIAVPPCQIQRSCPALQRGTRPFVQSSAEFWPSLIRRVAPEIGCAHHATRSVSPMIWRHGVPVVQPTSSVTTHVRLRIEHHEVCLAGRPQAHQPGDSRPSQRCRCLVLIHRVTISSKLKNHAALASGPHRRKREQAGSRSRPTPDRSAQPPSASSPGDKANDPSPPYRSRPFAQRLPQRLPVLALPRIWRRTLVAESLRRRISSAAKYR